MLPDHKDLIQVFNAHGVKYLIVGGHAVCLIKNKLAVGRHQDLADVEKLEQSKPAY